MHDGSRWTRSLNTNNWARAATLLQKMLRGDIVSPADSLADATGDFLADCALRNLRDSTIATYRFSIKALLGHFGSSRALASIDIRALGDYLRSRRLAPRTARTELAILRSFFRWCHDRQLIESNPANAQGMPRVDDVATLPFTDEEVRRLVSACDRIGASSADVRWVRHRARALVLLLAYSGLRIGDAAKLRRSALDVETGHLAVRTTKTGTPVKILLHPDAVNALATMPSTNPEYFFWSGRGKPETLARNLWGTIRALGQLAGVEGARPHRFRDTFAVALLSAGADIRTVQQLLGHDSVRTTERSYAHFVREHQLLLDSATSRLDFDRPARPVLMHPLGRADGNAK
jgi:integrase